LDRLILVDVDEHVSRCEVLGISHVRYTCRTVNRVIAALLVSCAFLSFANAEETSFQRIHVPDAKGKPTKGVLTFSDQQEAVVIRPAKGNAVTIPYREVDKFVYEYTKKHHVTEAAIATAPIGVGAIEMARKSPYHWLEINYHVGNVPRIYILRMDNRECLPILEAVKKHTAKDPEILGNADKRKK
jgi:hypothetical protein